MGIEVIEKHKAIISNALDNEAGRELAKLLRDTFVDVDLMGKNDRETVSRVAKHDLVIYLMELGGLKNV